MPSVEEMKKKVGQYALANGKLSEKDVAEFQAQLAADCPESTAAEHGATDELSRAYLTIQIKEGNAGSIGNVTATGNATAMPAPTVNAEETNQIVEGIAATKADRNMLSESTVITQLVLDKPAPSELIKAGTTGLINKKSWENIVKQYADKVLPDDADEKIKSTTNFNTLKAAFEAGTPVEVLIGAQSKKAVAVNVQIPDTTGSNKTTKPMNIEQFENFVVLKTSGYVRATEHTAGAKLRYVKPSKDKKNPNVMKPARVLLAFANRANAATDVSRNVLQEVKEDAACKSALSFKVDTGKKRNDGVTPVYKTIRVTVNAPVHLTERKDQYIDILPAVGKNKEAADLLTAPDQKAMKAINQAQVTKIAELRNKAAQGDFTTISEYGEALKAFGGSKAPAANVGM